MQSSRNQLPLVLRFILSLLLFAAFEGNSGDRIIGSVRRFPL